MGNFLIKHLAILKWVCTSFMFTGALITSLGLHPIFGYVFLVVGNASWGIVLLRMREWAAASVFVVMFSTWSIGLIRVLLL